MRIELITMWYNEEFLAPFFLNHYSWVDKIHLILDADTSDRTETIARQYPNVEIEQFRFPDMMDDILKVNKFNEKYRSLKDADYVILVDSDEFIFCNHIKKPVRDHIEATMKDVYFVNLWQVYKHEQDPPLDPEAAIPGQRRHGDPNMLDPYNLLYVKPIVVKGGRDLCWTPGNHELVLNGKSLAWKTRDDTVLGALNVSMNRDEMLQGAHWRLVDLEATITRRIRDRRDRQSSSNLANGMTYQYHTITDEEIVKEYDLHKDDPIVIVDDGLPWYQPVGPGDETSGSWTYHSPVFDSEAMFNDRVWPWAGHKWFAYDLVRNTTPQLVVELGTHKGTSLFSFCQAAKDAGLDTRICAIDTWQGDKHAGFYDDTVLQEVRQILHAHYPKVNCTLIQKTFDEALPLFADRSIDVLHIDGLHTYEAVKHDYETWRGKVRENGIILFHDIVVRENDFGVFKLWEELKRDGSTIQFLHSNGLGVLFQDPAHRLWRQDAEALQIQYLRCYESTILASLNNAAVSPVAQLEGYEEMTEVRALAAAGQYDEAIEKLKALTERRPDHALAHNDLGSLYCMKEDYVHALTCFEKAAECNPNNLTTKKNLADLHVVMGHFDAAAHLYHTIVSQEPDDVDALVGLGRLSLEAGNSDSARYFFQRILEVNPDQTDARQCLDILDKREGREPDAIPSTPGVSISTPEVSISAADKVDIDWTTTFDYKKLTEEELEEYSNIEVTRNLFEGGRHALKAWVYWSEFLTKRVWNTSIFNEISSFCNSIINPQILSLGCGYGGVELTVAPSLRKPYRILALDINEHILAQGRKEAREKGHNVTFMPLDLNFVNIKKDSFDLIYAHASLHHVLNLEHLLDQVYQGLRPNGRLVVQDIIGKTQVLFWKANVDFATDIVSRIPPAYVKGMKDPRHMIAPYVEPSIQKGMEGIRQEEIEQQIGEYFTPVKLFKYGSFIRLICNHPELGTKFNPDVPADREYLEKLFHEDLHQIESGNLQPTEMFAVFEKRAFLDMNRIKADAYFRLGCAHAQQKENTERASGYFQMAFELDPSVRERGFVTVRAPKTGDVDSMNVATEDRSGSQVGNSQGIGVSKKDLESHPDPRISIIIPVFNQVDYTKQCIAAVWATCQNLSYEVIVVDDCSTDGTHEYLESVGQQVRSFRNETNQGFILNCNFAAAQAKGEYIVLLNNDTIPQQGWLEGLLEPFQLYEKVAATGALMIHPDDKILEACSIVFCDGSGWNYGRGDSPNSPRYNFIRDVDYVSGGGMMVPRKIWDELGGLDTHYCPAYYDDIDFCFKARKAGYRVLYTPFSRIIHFEGMTGGTDVTKGVKRYQVVNRGKFIERWKDELKNQYENKCENVFRASRRGEGKRVLWIDHVLPLPNFNSGCLRMNHLMKSMVRLGHKITYVTLSNSDPENYSNVMRKMGVETVSLGYESWHNSDREGEIVDKVLDLLEVRGNNYDVVYLSFYWVAMLFIRKIRRRLPSAIIFVDSHDIHFLRTRREAELHRDREHRAKAEQTKIDELGVYSRADAVLTVTELDKQALLKELPAATVFLMPNAHDVVPVEAGFQGRKDLLFVGGFNHTPNVDAMLYFCSEIFPRVKEKIPDVKLWIVGSNPPESVKALGSESVTVTGWVTDTKPYLDQSRISIAPLRYGAGMKGKVGEAMCHGLPVITTSSGSEGMSIVNGEHAIVVDRPDEWVGQIVRLYRDEELWKKLSANGQALMSKQYGSDEMLKRTQHVLGFGSREEAAALSPFPAARMKSRADVSVSIIIVTHNQVEYTKECIASIKDWTTVPHRIMVVDNSSTDKTRSYLKGLPGIDVLLNEENAGFPAACNQALNRADGDYVLLLNNDVVVTEGWLDRLVDVAEPDPAIGVVGPITNSISGIQIDKEARYGSIKEMHKYARAVRKKNRGETAASPRVAFFCTLIRKEVIDRIGGLDERFSPGNFEDDDFCLRAQLAGFKTVVARDVFVHHYGSKSFGTGGKDAYAKRIETNRQVFMEKWGADPVGIWKEKKEFRKRNLRYPLSKDAFGEQFERAKILIEEKELALALISLKKAVEYFKSSERRGYSVEYSDILDLTGNVALAVNDPGTAESYFKRELRCSRDPLRAQAGLEKIRSAGRLLPSGPPGTANAAPSRPAGPIEVRKVLLHSEQLCYRGHVAEAIVALERAVHAIPDNGILRSTLAWLFIKNKMFEDVSRLIQSTPDELKRNCEWLEISGFCTEGQGDDEVAARCVDKALELSPGSVRALTLKGMLAVKAGNDAEAQRLFQHAIEEGRDAAMPLLHLGALLWRTGELEEALPLLEKAFLLDPADNETGITYYSAANSLGKLDDVCTRFRDASEKYPDHKQLKAFVADVLVRLGKYTDAMEVLEEAITRFGAEGDILPFALEVRKNVGLKEIPRSNGRHETISLCMIVKDEEQYLARCLSSVKSLVDEIIIVDTGSTDKTKDIAGIFGARVFDFTWTENFSEARNFSLSKATGDWILVLDGDEVLSPADHGQVKQLIASGKRKRAFSFTTRNYVGRTDIQDWVRNDGTYNEEAGTGWVPSVKVRLFPRLESIGFRGAVHELVEASLSKAKIEPRSCEIPVHHYGNLDGRNNRNKGETYVRLGRVKLAEAGPADLKALSELAIQENELGNYQQALEIWLRLVQLAPRNARAHMGVGSNYIGLGRFEDAVIPLRTSIDLEPDLHEATIRCSLALLMLGKASEATPLLERLVKRDPAYPYGKPMLSAILFCSGRKMEGWRLIDEIRGENVAFDPFFADLAHQLRDIGRVDDAVAILEPLFEAEIIGKETGLLLVECYRTQAIAAGENVSKVFP